MDSPKSLIIPTIICLTIAIILFKKFKSKKPKKKLDKSNIENNEEEKEVIEEKKNKLKNKKVKVEDSKEENEEEKEIEDKKEEIEDKKEEIDEEKEKKKELTYNILFDKFCDYIQKNKLVSVDAISKKLNKTKDETIKFLRELENEGKMVGFLGADGEYFYLSTKELDLLNNLLLKSKNNNISEEELEKQFQQIAKQGEEQSII